MQLDNKNTVKLNELIHWVKKELLSDQMLQGDDTVPLFVIDEVTVEVNFILTGEGEGGFDVKVLKAGAKVGEERVQKATVRMKPIITYDELTSEFAKRHPDIKEEVIDNSVKVFLKGRTVDDEMAIVGERQ